MYRYSKTIPFKASNDEEYEIRQTSRQRDHLQSLGGLRWTAILLAIPGIGWLVYETVKASAAMLR